MHSKRLTWNTVLLSASLMLTACGGPLADDTVHTDAAETLATSSDALNSPIYDRARAFAAANPTRDGGTWDQWCGSLMWRFGQMPESSARPSAIEAYYDSTIVSTDPSKALTGAFHWWAIGAYGHVGADLNGGGTAVFMATRKLSQSWGDAIGINSVSGYTSMSGARYLGWSMDYAGARIAGGGAPPGGGGIPQTSTEFDGIPGPIYYMRIQTVGQRDFGYTGPIDGITGPNTEKVRVRITARELNRRGGPYTSAQEDGIPGSIYWTRVQTVGRSFGYTGPIDGIPGPNTYKAEHMICAYAVNRAF
ncbi:hypothetical protein HPC49_20475 [Pyxidicoccus fallax]|uniref:Uncharacterized protein n=1 Tax=Pyxidicoccus fallax TaxID=394095 RepID=A0A848LE18_9BACT|nr:hypothetical protein [Pyxidicoccus fallax]NMO16634.1 hypothetical protein [Pyxidicoccus fallax]NPC80589.1 hypothetical protein [Pyxidicoccus fallax]